MRVQVIGSAAAVTGFRLAGIEGTVALDGLAAQRALEDALSREDSGLVLITESLANQMREIVDRHLYGSGTPLVLEIPDVTGPDKRRRPIEEIIRKAVGIKL
ncbi:MAG: V-type ATP synthase subunit F [Candidatus Hydrogenedentes bacterium]|nr:V-type ATP synthase subunit F [Candidatus Hydrogenedentota bacterium]